MLLHHQTLRPWQLLTLCVTVCLGGAILGQSVSPSGEGAAQGENVKEETVQTSSKDQDEDVLSLLLEESSPPVPTEQELRDLLDPEESEEQPLGKDSANTTEPDEGSNPDGGLLPVRNLKLGPGSLRGVVDGPDGRPVAGVIVVLQGLDARIMTDDEGQFALEGMPGGLRVIKFLKTGYKIVTREILILNDGPTALRQGLELRPIETATDEYLLDEIEVIEEFSEDRFAGITLGQADSPSFVSGIGRAEFEEAALSDAGDAVASISGANVVGGQFAVLRGLADRYVTTTFNGATIASAEPSRKAVQLDLFPTSALEAIDVSKTFHPGLPGDFGGGAIDILTRIYPSERTLSFKFKQSWDPSLPSAFLEHPDRELDFLGDNVGADLPQYLPVPGLLDTEFVRQEWQGLYDTRTLIPREGSPEQPRSLSMTYGDTFELNRGAKWGVMLAAGQATKDRFNQSRKFRNVRDGREWTQLDYARSVDWNLYAATGLQLGENHDLNAVYFRKHIAEDKISRGLDLRDPGELSLPFGDRDSIDGTRPFYDADALLTGSFYSIQPLERDFDVFQVLGDHKPFGKGPKVHWSFTNSNAMERRPDTSFFQFATLDFTSPELELFRATQEADLVRSLAPQFGADPDSVTWGELREQIPSFLLPIFEGNFPVVNESLGQIDTVATLNFNTTQGRGVQTTRLKQIIQETANDYRLGLSQEFLFDPANEKRGIELRAGTNLSRKERSSRGSMFELFFEARGIGGDEGLSETEILPANGDTPGNENLGERIAEDPAIVSDLFTGSLLGAPGFVNASTGTGNNANKIFNNADAEHNIDAFNLSGKVFWDAYYLLGGVRFADEDRAAQLRDPKPFGAAGEDPPSISEAVVLPSLTGGAEFLDGDIEILGAWSRTMARPTFHEWMPIRTFDLSSGTFRAGNPALDNSSITNMDLTANLRFWENLTLTVSGFYKRIEDPIVDVISVADSSLIQYINGSSGDLSGIEIEAELTDIGPFSLRGNLTYIDATLIYPVSNAGLVSDTVVQFPFQPEWIANLNLGYKNEDLGITANIVYNFTGEYATTLRSLNTGSDIVQSPQHGIDLVIGKKFGDFDGPGWELKGGIKNLWSSDRVQTYSGGRQDVDGRQFETATNERVFFVEGKYAF